MTAEDFRSNSAMRQNLRDLLESSLFITAKEAVLSKFIGKDVGLADPEVASTRLLSLRAGYESFVVELEQLTQPMPDKLPEEKSDFGEPAALARLEQIESELGPQYIPS